MTIREEIEWCDIRVTAANSPDIPRVLLVGDSITHNYYPTVEERLHGHCAVARLATSKCVCDPSYRGEVQLLLDTYPFSLIHLNNGLHGWGYSEEAYGDSLRAIVRFLREELPQAESSSLLPRRCGVPGHSTNLQRIQSACAYAIASLRRSPTNLASRSTISFPRSLTTRNSIMMTACILMRKAISPSGNRWPR